jgi:hypothetical protein
MNVAEDKLDEYIDSVNDISNLRYLQPSLMRKNSLLILPNGSIRSI